MEENLKISIIWVDWDEEDPQPHPIECSRTYSRDVLFGEAFEEFVPSLEDKYEATLDCGGDDSVYEITVVDVPEGESLDDVAERILSDIQEFLAEC